MAERNRNHRGIIEWVFIILPVPVILGAVLSYGRLTERVNNACATFQANLTRIESGGTSVSLANRERIAGMTAQLDGIEKSIQRIENLQVRQETNQQEIIRLLQRKGSTP